MQKSVRAFFRKKRKNFAQGGVFSILGGDYVKFAHLNLVDPVLAVGEVAVGEGGGLGCRGERPRPAAWVRERRGAHGDRRGAGSGSLCGVRTGPVVARPTCMPPVLMTPPTPCMYTPWRPVCHQDCCIHGQDRHPLPRSVLYACSRTDMGPREACRGHRCCIVQSSYPTTSHRGHGKPSHITRDLLLKQPPAQHQMTDPFTSTL